MRKAETPRKQSIFSTTVHTVTLVLEVMGMLPKLPKVLMNLITSI